jgi:hypothetical protein
MKYKLPILTAGFSCCLLAVCGLLAPRDLHLLSLKTPANSQQAVSEPATVSKGQGGSAAGQPPHGQWLVGRAVRELVKQESLQAEIRQQVDLYGHHLVGVGRYRQFFVAGEQRLRLELKLQLGEQVSTLTQVADGRHFWTRLDMPEETTLSRIDLRRVKEQVWQRTSSGLLAESSMWMALGGLPKLLQGLESHFEFSPPQAAHWKKKPVWVTEGTWKPALLKHHWETSKSIPEYIPRRVQLVLGRDSEVPLFPYRIRFWRSVEVLAEDTSIRPMVTLEFHRITRPTFFTRSMFEYKRGDQVVIDRTDTFLKHLHDLPWSLGGQESP